MVSNLNNIFDSAKEVHNLFSCFGNVVKVLLMKNLQKALVEFRDCISSRASADNLNSFRISSTVLKVNYSKYKTIDLKKNNKSENSKYYNEVFIPTKAD